MNGGGFDRISNLSGAQKRVAQAAFEIFSHNLGKELPAFPGSQAIDPFTPQQTARDFRSTIGDPLNDIFNQNLLGLVGPAGQDLAQQRLGEVTGALGSQFARQGEQRALQEFLRVNPETNPALGLANAFLGQSQIAQFQQPSQFGQIASAGLAGVNALGTAASLGAFGGPGITSSGSVPGLGQPTFGSPDTTGFNEAMFGFNPNPGHGFQIGQLA